MPLFLVWFVANKSLSNENHLHDHKTKLASSRLATKIDQTCTAQYISWSWVRHTALPPNSAAHCDKIVKIPWLTGALHLWVNQALFYQKTVATESWRCAQLCYQHLKKIINLFFLLKSAICQVKLCLFVTVCRTAMTISRAHSLQQFSLNFDFFS